MEWVVGGFDCVFSYVRFDGVFEEIEGNVEVSCEEVCFGDVGGFCKWLLV